MLISVNKNKEFHTYPYLDDIFIYFEFDGSMYYLKEMIDIELTFYSFKKIVNLLDKAIINNNDDVINFLLHTGLQFKKLKLIVVNIIMNRSYDLKRNDHHNSMIKHYLDNYD